MIIIGLFRGALGIVRKAICQMDKALADLIKISNTTGRDPALAAVDRGGVSVIAEPDADAADAKANVAERKKGEDHAGS